MKKYAVITMTTGDQFEELLDTEQEAIRSAARDWSVMLTKHDKARITDFYVAEVELDEDGCISLDSATVLKTYCRMGVDLVDAIDEKVGLDFDDLTAEFYLAGDLYSVDEAGRVYRHDLQGTWFVGEVNEVNLHYDPADRDTKVEEEK